MLSFWSAETWTKESRMNTYKLTALLTAAALLLLTACGGGSTPAPARAPTPAAAPEATG